MLWSHYQPINSPRTALFNTDQHHTAQESQFSLAT